MINPSHKYFSHAGVYGIHFVSFIQISITWGGTKQARIISLYILWQKEDEKSFMLPHAWAKKSIRSPLHHKTTGMTVNNKRLELRRAAAKSISQVL